MRKATELDNDSKIVIINMCKEFKEDINKCLNKDDKTEWVEWTMKIIQDVKIEFLMNKNMYWQIGAVLSLSNRLSEEKPNWYKNKKSQEVKQLDQEAETL